MFTDIDMRQIRVSIIVPVYNAKNYIGQCLSSIMEQTYKDFELIIVDDGSTDQSGEICDKFALQYRNVKVVHKQKQGVNSARIEGLHRASGYYISFVDADDWIDNDFLELLVTRMESAQADIVMTGCIKEKKGKSEMMVNQFQSGVYERNDLVKTIFPKMLHFQGFYTFGILPYMWNKMYKRENLLEIYNGIDIDIYDGEDVAVVFPYILQAYRAVICDEAKYHYRIHDGSVTAGKKPHYYANVAKLYLYLYSIFGQSEFAECMRGQLDQFLRRMVWNGNPESFIEADIYVFPFDKVPKGTSIILYAAGNVGRRYCFQIQRTGYCHLAAWVDGNWKSEKLRNLGVESPDVIKKRIYDYIVIAVENAETAEQIKSNLIGSGIAESSII